MKLSQKIMFAFFPRRCMGCGKVIEMENAFCEKCKNDIFRIQDPRCFKCGVDKKNCICPNKTQNYKKIVSPFYYSGTVKKALLKMKRKSVYSLFFAEETAKTVKKYLDVSEIDLVCAVPMTKQEKREKGYNQASVLAEKTAECLCKAYEETLIKTIKTTPQHSLPRSLRAGNVRGIYDIIRGKNVSGKTVLLMDDIKTSGATLNECALMLKLNGAKEVYAAVAAVVK